MSLSGKNLSALRKGRSCSDLAGLDALFVEQSIDEVKSERGREPSSSASSESTESSDGFVIDGNCITINANSANAMDDTSDLVDSVATLQSHYSRPSNKVRKKSSEDSPSPQSSRLGAFNGIEDGADSEDSEAELEAYLRAKMFSLWGRIQEDAGVAAPSEMPAAQDAELLREYAIRVQ